MLGEETKVVIAGGGPTGLALASTLRQAGHDVLALDRQAVGANDATAMPAPRPVSAMLPRQAATPSWGSVA